MSVFIGGQRDVKRYVECTCGWRQIFPTLKATNAAVAVHFEEGVEGCDHAVDIEELEYRKDRR